MRPSPSSARALIPALVAGLLAATTAKADTATEASFFDDLARHDYEHRQFQRALDSFLLVHTLTPSPRSLYNVAICADLAGKPDLAFSFLDEYARSTDDDSERRRDAVSRLDALRKNLAVLEVASHPAGAAIVIDRAELGTWGVAPRSAVVDPGTHTVTLTLDGYRPAHATIVAQRGAAVAVELTLEAILGDVQIVTTPSHAELRVERDGKPVDVAPDARALKLPVGPYRFRLEAPGYVPADAEVAVTEQPTNVSLVARALPIKVGSLLVDTGKDVASVILDGKTVAATPAALPRVSVGRHRVTLSSRGKLPWSTVVDLHEGEALYLNATLADAEARKR